jgi:hypothetical protein
MEILLILTLDLYRLPILGLDVQLRGLDTGIDLCFHQPLLRCSCKGTYTPRKYQAVSVEFQGEHTHDMDTGLCYLSGTDLRSFDCYHADLSHRLDLEERGQYV